MTAFNEIIIINPIINVLHINAGLPRPGLAQHNVEG